KLHAIWLDRRATNDDVYYANSTDGGLTWSLPAARVDNSPAGVVASMADIAVNKGGSEVYVVYRDSRVPGSPGIYSAVSLNSGLTWAAGARVDDAPPTTAVQNPSISVDAAGTVYVAWEDQRNTTWAYQIQATVSTTQGSSWAASQQISATATPYVSSVPAVAAAGTGNAWIAWRQSGGGAVPDAVSVARSSDSGTLWTFLDAVTGASGAILASPDVTGNAAGRVDVVYTNQETSEELRFIASADYGATWSAPYPVGDVPAAAVPNPDTPTVHIVAGDPYVVWADSWDTSWSIYASGSDDNGVNWGDCPTPCAPLNDARVDDMGMADPFAQQRPASASSAFGLYVVWQDTRNNPATNDIYFAAYVISKVQITEFRDSPDGTSERVELINFGGKATDLTGYTLNVDGFSYSLTSLGSVPANTYRTVGPPGSGSSLEPIGFSVGGSVNQGGFIELRDFTSTVIDSVRYGQQGTAPDPLNGITTARYFDGASYEDCWALDLSPTIGVQNDGPTCGAPPELILNEVLYDATNPSARFVELYYTGSTSLDTTGYRLQGNSVYTITTGTVLTPANRQALVWNDDSVSATLLFNNLLPGGDNLYLYRPTATGALLDEVGWNTLHTVDTSVCRVPEGTGTSDGYDDATSVTARWQFGCAPNPSLVAIGPDQSQFAYFGDTVWFTLTVTNKQQSADTLDITYTSQPNGWAVALFQADGVTPLPDTDADFVPDTGVLAVNGQVDIMVRIMVPGTPQASEVEWVNVTATASLTALGWDTAILQVKFYPYLSTFKDLSPATVNIQGTGWGEIAMLTLEVIARGEPFPRPSPMDVVMMIDSSGSMAGNDPPGPNDRRNAAKYFIDLMNPPDRVSILDFDENCAFTQANIGGVDHHLNSPGHDGVPDYNDPKNDVDTIDDAGATNLLCPIVDANAELVNLGDPTHVWVEIMLTDGQDTSGNLDATIITEAQNAAAAGIIIFTIGLGAGANAALLQQIAAETNGLYYSAPDPSYLQDIYGNISAFLDNLTAVDPYNPITFPEQMIKEVLPPYISVVPFSFFLPPQNDVEVDPTPDIVAGGNLSWQVSQIRLNQTWAVSWQITCSQIGTQPVELYPDSRAAYLDWNDTLKIVPFPAMDITCLQTIVPAVEPPTEVTTGWNGASVITLTWTPPITAPDHYLIYKVLDDPRNFADFSPAAAYASVPFPATSWSDPTPIGVASEYYYLMRSANAGNTDVSRTSNTAGVFAGTLNSGMTSISRPLEYFPWLNYFGAPLDTVDEYRAAFGAQWIEYMDAGGTWQRVCPSGPPACPGNGATVLAVGKGYVVNRATPGRFVFTGLPGTHLLFDEFPAPGFVPATTAWSLMAAVNVDNVILTWSAVPGVTNYEVLYATTRAGFFDGSAVTLGTTAALSWTHLNAIPLSSELYYLVKPAGSAASSYSIGIWTVTYTAHGTFGLPLKPIIIAPSVSYYTGAIPGTLGVVWMSLTGVWVAHVASMPAGVYDKMVYPGIGYQLTVKTTGRYSFIGW
ncbi:MAG TPA: lamin tail domain-containing protein, partial [Thermoplasmata archaeon]|nr:lamin tail domain-containing protein [Thermoplasmata archaeon]